MELELQDLFGTLLFIFAVGFVTGKIQARAR